MHQQPRRKLVLAMIKVGTKWAAFGVLAALVAGCGGGDGAADVAVVSPATLTPGDRVPVPSEPVLVVDGMIADGNDGGALALDFASLEDLELVETVVYEPFEERDVTFTGVRVTDLLDLAGADVAATEVHMHALDDYTVDFTLDELAAGDAILATQADGARMPVEHAGPTRIVFLDGSQVGENKDLWIWSLDRITVR